MIEPTEVAWAAGLFDGEGTVRKPDHRNRMLAVAMTDLGILQRIQRAVDGVGGISGPRYQKGRKPIWVWYACSADARHVATTLLPYVDERNRKRLSDLIANYDADKAGVCEWCGIDFPRVHRDRRFCSQSCKSKAWRARQAS